MISKEMEELLSKGAIASVEPDEVQFLSTLFLVFKKDDKGIPVINLKYLNQFILFYVWL